MGKYSETTSTLAGLMQSSCDEVSGDYWNIDDILAEEEMVPCTFNVDARGLTYLKQMSNTAATIGQAQAVKAKAVDKVLQAGTKIDLPTWMGVSLAQREIVELNKPLFLTSKFFDQVKAGSDVVTMRNHSLYIYEVVLKLIELYPNERIEDIMTVFIEAFIDRFSKITLDHSTNAQASHVSAATKKLSNLEKEIFELHRAQKLDFIQYKTQNQN